MKIKRNTSIAGLALLTALSVSCSKIKVPGQGKNNDSGGNETTGTPPETGEASTVTMSGSLALALDDSSALSLTAASYNLYCVTFEESPKACKGEIAGDGNFAFGCEGFVGRGFGCFLRDGVKTLGTVEFGEESQLVAGAGNLVFKMVFNPETGSITAEIDKEASSALSEEALAAFKDFLNNNKTTMADLTGNWEIKPDCSKNPDMCPEDIKGDETFPVYMEQYTAGNGKNYLAMWNDEARKNQCGGSADLSFKIAGAAVDFKSKDALLESLRKAMGSLDSGLRTKLKALAIARGNKQFGWCENNQDTPFTVENCKLIKPAFETHSYYDKDGNQKTASYPKYYGSDEFDALKQTTADSVADVSCSFEWKEGIPGCPWNATKKADGSGTFKQAMAGGVGLMLICRDPHNDKNLMHEPAPGKTLAESIQVLGKQTPKECEKITDGDFAGQYRAAAQEAARAILDMARINPNDGWAKEMCDRYTVPSDWSWAKCVGNNDWNMPSLCWEGQWQRENLGIVIKDGKLAATDGQKSDWFNSDEYLDICPVAAKEANTAQQSQNPEMDNNFAATYLGKCRTEILAKTPIQQAQAFSKSSQQWQPLGEILYCDASTKAAVSALASKSCTADAHLDHQCGPNGCEEVLMCSGSSAKGRCYDDAGNFAGRVSGRDDNMVLKMGVGGAFSMHQSEQDVWRRWNPDTNEQQKCVYSRISSMNNLRTDDNSFSGIYSSKSRESCEADSQGDKMALTEGDQSSDGGKDSGRDTMTIPFTATRK